MFKKDGKKGNSTYKGYFSCIEQPRPPYPGDDPEGYGTIAAPFKLEIVAHPPRLAQAQES